MGAAEAERVAATYEAVDPVREYLEEQYEATQATGDFISMISILTVLHNCGVRAGSDNYLAQLSASALKGMGAEPRQRQEGGVRQRGFAKLRPRSGAEEKESALL